MDTTFKRINLEEEPQTVSLDNVSAKAVLTFAKFLRDWERGTFQAEIVSHKDGRFVKLTVSDIDRIDLPAKK